MGAHGYRRLGFLAGPADSPDAQDRLAAFRQPWRSIPGASSTRCWTGTSPRPAGPRRRGAAGRGPLPDAVACANDQMAIGVLREFQQAGVAVPGDVAVTGFDDIYASRIVTPALTTVSQPLRELGHQRRATAARPHRGPGPAAAHRDPAHPVRDPGQLRLPAPGSPLIRAHGRTGRPQAGTAAATQRGEPDAPHPPLAAPRDPGAARRPGRRRGRISLTGRDADQPDLRGQQLGDHRPRPPSGWTTMFSDSLLRGGRLQASTPAGPTTPAPSTTAPAARRTGAPARSRATPIRPRTCPRTAAAT